MSIRKKQPICMLRTSGIIVVVCGPKDVRSLDCGLLGCLGGNSFLWARTWRVWPDVDVLGCVDSVLFQRFLSVRFIGGGGGESSQTPIGSILAHYMFLVNYF